MKKEIKFIDELRMKGCQGSLSCGRVRFSPEQAQILLDMMEHLEEKLIFDIELWKRGKSPLSIPIRSVLVNEFLEGFELGKMEILEEVIADLVASGVLDSRIKVDLVKKYQKIIDNYSGEFGEDKRRKGLV